MRSWAMNERPFLIAGGGIAGLAAGLALARTGRSVQVFERAEAFEETGAGIQISPNAVRALRFLGAWDAIEPNCAMPSEIHVCDGRSGALLQRIRLGKSFESRFGAPYRVAHRADLLQGLLQTAQVTPLIDLHTGKKVQGAENTDRGALLHFTGGAPEHGAAIIAADGIRSTIRNAIMVRREPVYRGHAIYRALVPFDKVPLSIAADCVTLWLYPGGHVVHYAVSNWRQFNIVAALDSPWREDGWRQPAAKAEVTNGFADAAAPLAELLATVLAWTKFAAADLDPFPAWTHGNIALIGDAAHANLPYLAQGAAMALEDTCVLANCLASKPSIAAGLADYARLRQPRTARIQRESRRLASLYHARGLVALARNTVMWLAGPQYALERNQWIYNWEP